jgi:hypothetical protein
LEIIEFRPWLVSGQRDLIEAFFKVLSEALDDSTHRQQRTKKRWLGRAKAVADPVVDAAAALGTALHPNDGPGIKASAAFTKATTKNVIDAWLAEPSLQKAYQELIARLDASQRRFLVIIDDIDRLQPDEIRSVMQMVKSIGRLPRTIYLLSYDRRIVWSALEPRAAPESGEPTFMEKIVQHELELPLAGRSALLRLLDQNIGFVTGEAADDCPPISRRRRTAIQKGPKKGFARGLIRWRLLDQSAYASTRQGSSGGQGSKRGLRVSCLSSGLADDPLGQGACLGMSTHRPDPPPVAPDHGSDADRRDTPQTPEEVRHGVRQQRKHIQDLDGEDPLRGGVAD